MECIPAFCGSQAPCFEHVSTNSLTNSPRTGAFAVGSNFWTPSAGEHLQPPLSAEHITARCRQCNLQTMMHVDKWRELLQCTSWPDGTAADHNHDDVLLTSYSAPRPSENQKLVARVIGRRVLTGQPLQTLHVKCGSLASFTACRARQLSCCHSCSTGTADEHL